MVVSRLARSSVTAASWSRTPEFVVPAASSVRRSAGSLAMISSGPAAASVSRTRASSPVRSLPPAQWNTTHPGAALAIARTAAITRSGCPGQHRREGTAARTGCRSSPSARRTACRPGPAVLRTRVVMPHAASARRSGSHSSASRRSTTVRTPCSPCRRPSSTQSSGSGASMQTNGTRSGPRPSLAQVTYAGTQVVPRKFSTCPGNSHQNRILHASMP